MRFRLKETPTMSVRNKASLMGLALCVLAAPAVSALDKEAKKWLDEVKPIMLPDEEKTYRDLKDKNDVAEFQKIFWARRDPDLETPANEHQAEYQKARTEADTKFRIGGTPGSQTDCGRVYILLGPPDEVKKGEMADSSIPGRRNPENWIYRDRPGFKFGPTGQIEIGFDESCLLPQGARMGEQLNRLAEGRVASPNIGYRRGPDGKIVKLVDQLPKPSPANALLKTPRQDFPVSAESTMLLRGQDGASYVAGLIKGDASALTVKDAGGKKAAKVIVGIQALDETGKSAGSSERELMVDVAPDNSYVASYGMALKPGTYTMKVAVLDPQTNKGSVATMPLKLPDYDAEGLSLSPMLILRDVQEVPANPQDPLSAFQLGPMRFVPHYGNVFSPQDSITLLTFLYNPKVDEATGKPSTTASFVILKDGKPVAKADDQNYDTLGAGPSVGPVPLTKFTPGKYVAQVKIKDNVAKKDLTGEATFEVK
jgi:GWxTD domain-containing protein